MPVGQVQNVLDNLRTRVSGLRPNLLGGNVASQLGGRLGGGQLLQQAKQSIGNAKSRVMGVMSSRPTPVQDAARAATRSGDGLLATNFATAGPMSGYRSMQGQAPIQESGSGYRMTV